MYVMYTVVLRCFVPCLHTCGEGVWYVNMSPWYEQWHGDTARTLATDVSVVEALVRTVCSCVVSAWPPLHVDVSCGCHCVVDGCGVGWPSPLVHHPARMGRHCRSCVATGCATVGLAQAGPA